MFEKIKSAFNKLTTKELSDQNMDEVFWDLQLSLLQSDVALEVAEAITEKIKEKLRGERVGRFTDLKTMLKEALKESIKEILTPKSTIEILALAEENKLKKEPLVIVFLGVNGTGKTTTIAKIGQMLKKKGYNVVFAASDTFRAGSIEQLEEHGRRTGIRVIRHDYGGDSAAVAYDAIQHAASKGVNAVLIDTAGRMQTNKNLLEEVKKIVRVANPNLTIFVGDALAGNDAVEQAKRFNEAVGFDAVILTKIDADSKGGASLSITFATEKPIIAVGTGQKYDDLASFSPEWFLSKILD